MTPKERARSVYSGFADLELQIKQAQNEAVEKTKQACWDFFLNFGVGCFTPTPDEQEYLILDHNYERVEWEEALTLEKILRE